MSERSTGQSVDLTARLRETAEPRRAGLSRKHREWVAGYLFVLPDLIGLIIFLGIPMVLALSLGFFEVDGFGHYTWIGLDNYHAMVHDDRAYLGFWDGGMVVIDITDPTSPATISRLGWEEGGHTHTCLPLPERDLVVVTDEAITDGCEGARHMVRVVDISDETTPFVRSICPVPEGDFCERGLRFGSHCLHENRPNSYRSQELVFVTYFNAGLRVYDLADPDDPVEIAHWIPQCPPNQAAAQINDVFVAEDHTVYVTDRINGGVYVLEPDLALSARMTQSAARASS